jgi:LytR cell envelope-related transcriptional attenuator
MALPSAVTLGSLALIVAAGAGLGVISSSSGHEDRAGSPPQTIPPTSSPTTDGPASPRRHRPRDPVPKTLIDVFNNSGIADLAAKKAAFLSGAGWNVAATDNWYGDIPADTVYFPPRLRDDAVALAKTLHINRLHRAVAPMQFDRLTVILTGG